MNKTVVFVNGEKYDLEDSHVKVGTLIELGGGNTSDYELQQRKGEGGPIVHTYKDPEEIICVKNGTHFITHLIAPVIPAWLLSPPLFFFEQYLIGKKISYQIHQHGNLTIFEIQRIINHGKYTDVTITIGLPIPIDFEVNPPYGLHVKKEFGVVQNVTKPAASLLGAEWEFWSRQIKDWNAATNKPQYYLDHVDRWLELWLNIVLQWQKQQIMS